MADTVDHLAIAMAQLNPTVGDVLGNEALVLSARQEAAKEGADLVVCPELVLSGYPPEDLVLKPAFLAAVRAGVDRLAAATMDGGPALLVGAPWVEDGKTYNAGLLLDAGRIAAKRFKHDLPNYGVFDEKRVFAAGPPPGPIVFRGVRLGVMICEDMWTPDVAETLEESGAELLIVPNGSPFETDKVDERIQLAVARVTETGLPLMYVNQVGGQDELVFDGASFVLDANRRLCAQAAAFMPSVTVTRWRREPSGDRYDGRWTCEAGAIVPPPDMPAATYAALTLGLRDYVRKNGFPGVILGLSGGVDSALCCALAVDALGPERVLSVMMPSPYTSRDSLDDAADTAARLGCRLETVSIEPAMAAFDAMLAPMLAGRPPDITQENIQSRARGVTLMALSNAFGSMVLSTGNKSEMSCGYATLYGDMCGGFAVLKDVYKTTVYDLCRWRNAHRPGDSLGPDGVVIPERVLTKAPTAELKPNQTDQDTLPPYADLDAILAALIEREADPQQIVALGFDATTVHRVWRMLDRAEYKRRQSAPGVKITRRSFGRERRYPITNGFTSTSG